MFRHLEALRLEAHRLDRRADPQNRRRRPGPARRARGRSALLSACASGSPRRASARCRRSPPRRRPCPNAATRRARVAPSPRWARDAHGHEDRPVDVAPAERRRRRHRRAQRPGPARADVQGGAAQSPGEPLDGRGAAALRARHGHVRRCPRDGRAVVPGDPLHGEYIRGRPRAGDRGRARLRAVPAPGLPARGARGEGRRPRPGRAARARPRLPRARHARRCAAARKAVGGRGARPARRGRARDRGAARRSPSTATRRMRRGSRSSAGRPSATRSWPPDRARRRRPRWPGSRRRELCCSASSSATARTTAWLARARRSRRSRRSSSA